MADTTPGAPVPPDDLISSWDTAYYKYDADFSCDLRVLNGAKQAAAWGYAQAMQEREKLINLLCESAKIANSYRNIPSPEYGMLSLGVHAMQCRAAIERLSGGGGGNDG
jgi:hypothetical protein